MALQLPVFDPPLMRTIAAGPIAVVYSWCCGVTPATYWPLEFVTAIFVIDAAYTVAGAMTAAQTRPVKIHAPVDIRGRRMTAPRCSGMVAAHSTTPRPRAQHRAADSARRGL